MHEWGFLIAAIFFCLLGNGFFSGSEIALLSAKRGEIEALINQGNHRAVRVKHLQDDPDTLLATVQIGVTLMGTLAGVLGGYLAKLYVEPLVARSSFGPWVAPAVVATLIVGGGIVYIELVLGELVPKALALRYSTSAAMLVSGPVRLMEQVSRLLIAMLKASTRAVLLVFGIRDKMRVIRLGFLMSLAIELTQCVLILTVHDNRWAEANDIIANVLGVYLGYLAFHRLLRVDAIRRLVSDVETVPAP